MKRKGVTGLKLWRARVQKVYASLAELRAYDETFEIVKRCGYRNAESLWNANPLLQGSTHPADFGVANAH